MQEGIWKDICCEKFPVGFVMESLIVIDMCSENLCQA